MSGTKKRCVIIGAADIGNYERARSYLSKDIEFAVNLSENSHKTFNSYNRNSGSIDYQCDISTHNTDCEYGCGNFYVFCDGGLKHREGLGVEPDLIVGDFDSSDRPELDVETVVLPKEKDDTDTFFAVKEAIRRGFDDFLLLGVFGQRLDHTLGNISILLYLAGSGKNAIAVDDFAEFEIIRGRGGTEDSAKKESACREKSQTDCFFAEAQRRHNSFEENSGSGDLVTDKPDSGEFGSRDSGAVGSVTDSSKSACSSSDAQADSTAAKCGCVKRIDGGFSYFSVISLSEIATGVNIKNAKFPLSCGKISHDYQYGISNEALPGKIAEVSLSEGELLLMRVF